MRLQHASGTCSCLAACAPAVFHERVLRSLLNVSLQPQVLHSPPRRHSTASPALQQAPLAPPPPARAAAKNAALAAAFGDDEEDDKPKRKLIPLQYTPAELAAAQVDIHFRSLYRV